MRRRFFGRRKNNVKKAFFRRANPRNCSVPLVCHQIVIAALSRVIIQIVPLGARQFKKEEVLDNLATISIFKKVLKSLKRI